MAAETTRSDCIVRFSKVHKSYGSAAIVHGIDLEIRRGEFLTLLGPSGSGKTTLLMMLAGFEAPTAGSIEMDGRRIDAVPAHRRDIGVVFQNYALFPHLTVAENLAFPLQVRRCPKAEIQARVRRALQQVHLEAMGERRPHQLSGGQQQRIALARAMIFEPRLIVLDEPLGALDKNLREHMQLELKRLHRELGITMVFVTHDQAEALTLSDRVAVFNKGRIEQIDSPERLYGCPKTPYIATFVGENNLIDAQATGEGVVDRLFETADGTLLKARPAQVLPKGRAVTLALRPEEIAPVPIGVPPVNGQATFWGVVRERIFLGDLTKLVVAAEGIGDMRVTLGTQACRGGRLEVGLRTQFQYAVDRVAVFPSGSRNGSADLVEQTERKSA
jgi:putative spermidine/putrescine transport system ATP-binding protein